MLYVVMFDFALAALVIVGLGVFVFCWIAFGKELMHKSMEREFVVPIAANATATPAGKRCA
jgi:hypothetical protein